MVPPPKNAAIPGELPSVRKANSVWLPGIYRSDEHYGSKYKAKVLSGERIPLPFGGFENITNFNMLFLNETLPEEFDILLQATDRNETNFAHEPVIFDYRPAKLQIRWDDTSRRLFAIFHSD